MYRYSYPLISVLCLLELEWLGSPKVKQYIQQLKSNNCLAARLILWYFYEPHSWMRRQAGAILSDPEVVKFVLGASPGASTDDIQTRLWNFQQSSASEQVVSYEDLVSIAGRYFDSYSSSR